MNENLNKVLNRITEEENLAKEFCQLDDMDEMYKYCLELGEGYTEEEFDEGISELISALHFEGETTELSDGELDRIAGGLDMKGMVSKTAAIVLSALTMGGVMSSSAKAVDVSQSTGTTQSFLTRAKAKISDNFPKTKEAWADLWKNHKGKIIGVVTVAAVALAGGAALAKHRRTVAERQQRQEQADIANAIRESADKAYYDNLRKAKKESELTVGLQQALEAADREQLANVIAESERTAAEEAARRRDAERDAEEERRETEAAIRMSLEHHADAPPSYDEGLRLLREEAQRKGSATPAATPLSQWSSVWDNATPEAREKLRREKAATAREKRAIAEEQREQQEAQHRRDEEVAHQRAVNERAIAGIEALVKPAERPRQDAARDEVLDLLGSPVAPRPAEDKAKDPWAKLQEEGRQSQAANERAVAEYQRAADRTQEEARAKEARAKEAHAKDLEQAHEEFERVQAAELKKQQELEAARKRAEVIRQREDAERQKFERSEAAALERAKQRQQSEAEKALKEVEARERADTVERERAAELRRQQELEAARAQAELRGRERDAELEKEKARREQQPEETRQRAEAESQRKYEQRANGKLAARESQIDEDLQGLGAFVGRDVVKAAKESRLKEEKKKLEQGSPTAQQERAEQKKAQREKQAADRAQEEARRTEEARRRAEKETAAQARRDEQDDIFARQLQLRRELQEAEKRDKIERQKEDAAREKAESERIQREIEVMAAREMATRVASKQAAQRERLAREQAEQEKAKSPTKLSLAAGLENPKNPEDQEDDVVSRLAREELKKQSLAVVPYRNVMEEVGQAEAQRQRDAKASEQAAQREREAARRREQEEVAQRQRDETLRREQEQAAARQRSENLKRAAEMEQKAEQLAREAKDLNKAAEQKAAAARQRKQQQATEDEGSRPVFSAPKATFGDFLDKAVREDETSREQSEIKALREQATQRKQDATSLRQQAAALKK